MVIISRERPIRKAIFLMLFLLPIGYVAEIAAVAVHEIIGHGLSALIVGGKFSGFVLRWDGGGWAFTSVPPTYHVLHLASGVIATMIFGTILLGLVFLFPKRTDIQLALLIFSFFFLMEGIPYILWNSYRPVPPGDIGRIILHSCGENAAEESLLRWFLLAMGSILFLGLSFLFYTWIFSGMEKLILNGKQFTGGSRIFALFFLVALPGIVGWCLFDWNQLAPGVGILPYVVEVLSVISIASILFWFRPQPSREHPPHPITWRCIAVSWTCLIVTVLAMALWFNQGVQWD
jgi:hypothetical protein